MYKAGIFVIFLLKYLYGDGDNVKNIKEII